MASPMWADTVETYEDAVQVVLEGIGMRADPRKVLWCNYPALSLERDELEEKVEKDSRKLEKVPDRIWYVGVPKFRLIRRGIARLNCIIDLFYVASDDSLSWYGKLMPRADEFNCPLLLISPLIDALTQGSIETREATVVERAPGYSIYDFMGREWKIPDAFLGFLWALKERGKGFDGLLDPVTCLAVDKFTRELPSPRALDIGDYEAIATCLKEQMGYPDAKAEEAAKYVTAKFSGETLENKIKYALKYLGS